MNRNLKLTIPTPCHENWAAMTPTDKGRFCATCQKNVIDFTRSSDREIIDSYKHDENLCGKFRKNQLDRELIYKKEKKSFTLSARIALMTAILPIPQQIYAQETIKTVASENGNLQTDIHPGKRTISFMIYDNQGLILPLATIINMDSGQRTESDYDGKAVIEAKTGDKLQISYVGFENQTIAVNNNSTIQIQFDLVDQSEIIYDVYGRPEKQRTFIGRIFHNIGNLFR